MKEKFVIIDGNSLFYRSYFALPLLKNSTGEYSNAVYGFAMQIVKIIHDINPKYMAVAFDVTKHTFRHDIYADYKAHRKPMPQELFDQIEPLKQMLKYMHIKICEQPNIEGDDIVGTLCKKFDGVENIILTGDRDTLQLIDDHTKVYFTKKGTSDIYIVDEDVLLRDFSISPSQVVDLKALMGDVSDNIPGVAGIGPKTATELLKQYGNLQGIYSNIHNIKGPVKDKLIKDKGNAFLSYNLAKIKTDVDIDCKLKECELDYPFNSDVRSFFEKYEFKTLLKKSEIFAEDIAEILPTQTRQFYIRTQKEFENMLNLLQNAPKFAFFECDDFLSFSVGETEYKIEIYGGMFIDLMPDIWKSIKPLLESDRQKVLFDSKKMRHYFAKLGINLADPVFDVSIARHLAEGISVKSINEVYEDEYQKQTPATMLFLLADEYESKLTNFGMKNLYYNVELPLAKVLYDMELDGFKIDIAVLENLSAKYKAELAMLETQICELCGQKFNVNSPKQLSEVLYGKLNLPHNRKQSTTAENLESIADSHPVVPLILRYRKIAKLNSTYIDGFRPHIDASGLVHTRFNQTLTTTGRLSSVEPNLQNIPTRSEENKAVRSMFIARSKQHILVDADYSQIELRLLAHLSEDEFFVNAFNSGEDIHTSTASMVFGVDKKDVTDEMRRTAKVVNFGIIYGIGEHRLAADLKTSTKQAREYIDNFYNSHPKVKEFLEGAVKIAKETGRVSTILGRSRRMLDINSSNGIIRSGAERASQNMPLQGSAADIVKIAMVSVSQKLKEQGLKAKLILQVHDELIIDCPIAERKQVETLVADCMQNAYQLIVPLIVDVKSAYRWSDAH